MSEIEASGYFPIPKKMKISKEYEKNVEHEYYILI